MNVKRGLSSEFSRQHIVVKQYDAYLDGSLSAAEQEAYKRHLEQCADCKRWFERTQNLVAALQREAPAASHLSHAASTRIKQELRSYASQHRRVHAGFGTVGTVLAWSAALVLIAVIVWQAAGPLAQFELRPLFIQSDQFEPALNDDLVDRLIEAVNAGNVEAVGQLLQAGADPNTIEEQDAFFSNPILRTAVTNDDIEMAELLIAHGADADSYDSSGFPILWRAIRNDNLAMTQLLLDAGADANAQNEKGESLLAHAVASSGGKVAIVEALLAAGADTTSVIHTTRPLLDPTIEPALSVAAYYGYVEIAELLLDAGADIAAPSHFVDNDIECETQALHIAALGNRPAIIELLLDSGADINALNFQESTPLYFAADQGSVEAARVLIERGADVNLAYMNRSTPLEATSSAEIRQMLIAAGAQE